MRNKEFLEEGVRLTVDKIKKALQESPENKELQELLDIYQLMLEDGN